MVAFSPSDNLSGVKSTYYWLDDGGSTPYTGPFSLTPGALHTVKYESADWADNVEARTTLTVDLRYAVMVTVGSVTGRRGGKVTFSATVTRTSNGAKLSGKTVTFQVGSLIRSAVTNSRGIASFSYTIPTTWASGTYDITATTPDDATYLAGYGTGVLTVK